jgi:HEAT repeat protein
VLAALRRIARRDADRTLRAAALIALGRAGTEEDARLFVELLKDPRQPRGVREGAAVALGILPPFERNLTRRNVAAYLAYVMRHPSVLPARARGLAILGAGLRARHDPLLRMQLIGHAAGRIATSEEAADVAYACGLCGDPMIVPELLRAARRGVLGGRRLEDGQRALAVQALALIGDESSMAMLVKVLRSRRSGLETQRGAALALGRMLREHDLDDTLAEGAVRALKQVLEKGHDPFLRGLAAVGLGGARPPGTTEMLLTALARGGNAEVKPFCALGLGLAARTLDEDAGNGIRASLLEELKQARQVEIAASLSLALGLARSHEATELLLERVRRRSLPAPVRGAAAQGLGLMGKGRPEVVATLTEIALKETSGHLLEDAVLALGLMGHRHVARDLAALLPRATSSHAQGRIMLALAHLQHRAAVDPLLDILRNPKHPTLGREFAAVALGLLGNRRDRDLLFWIDAHFNYYAGTRATHELVRLY